MNENPLDARARRQQHRDARPLDDLDSMRSSAAHTHASYAGDSVRFFAELVTVIAMGVRWVAMLPVRLVRRRRGDE